MRFLTAELILFIVFVTDYVQTELHPDGKNVCLTTETYEDTVVVPVEKKKKSKKWCWRGRCVSTKLVYEDEPRVFKRTRIVPKCCDGYEEQDGLTYCMPLCIQGCVHGTCLAPNYCRCYPGYYGPRCTSKCPDGYWGVNCVNKCLCSEKGKCKRETGCECKPGWMGETCDLKCEEGYYGKSCEKKCNCDSSCNHETGECNATQATASPINATNAEASYPDLESGAMTEAAGTLESEMGPEMVTKNVEASYPDLERGAMTEAVGTPESEMVSPRQFSHENAMTEAAGTLESEMGSEMVTKNVEASYPDLESGAVTEAVGTLESEMVPEMVSPRQFSHEIAMTEAAGTLESEMVSPHQFSHEKAAGTLEAEMVSPHQFSHEKAAGTLESEMVSPHQFNHENAMTEAVETLESEMVSEEDKISPQQFSEENAMTEAAGTLESEMGPEMVTKNVEASYPDLERGAMTEAVGTLESEMVSPRQFSNKITAVKERDRLGVSESFKIIIQSIRSTSSTTTDLSGRASNVHQIFMKEIVTGRASVEGAHLNATEMEFQNKFNFSQDLKTESFEGTEGVYDANEITKDEEKEETATKHNAPILAADDTETDNTNLMSDLNESLQNNLHPKFHFLASLSILSSISVIIFAIAARWVIVSHQRKIQKFTVTTQKEKILQTEKLKFQAKNLLWVQNCMDNPAYLSDVDIKNEVPVLHTFKPVK